MEKGHKDVEDLPGTTLITGQNSGSDLKPGLNRLVFNQHFIPKPGCLVNTFAKEVVYLIRSEQRKRQRRRGAG